MRSACRSSASPSSLQPPWPEPLNRPRPRALATWCDSPGEPRHPARGGARAARHRRVASHHVRRPGLRRGHHAHPRVRRRAGTRHPRRGSPSYRLIDDRGAWLELRSDATVPLARVAATRYHGHNEPLRFWYAQTVFRPVPALQGRSREIAQAGVELFGVPGEDGDREVLGLPPSACRRRTWLRLASSSAMRASARRSCAAPVPTRPPSLPSTPSCSAAGSWPSSCSSPMLACRRSRWSASSDSSHARRRGAAHRARRSPRYAGRRSGRNDRWALCRRPRPRDRRPRARARAGLLLGARLRGRPPGAR